METVFLCEGYNDRGFLKGWLHALDCKDCHLDRDGKEVGKGNFGFETPKGQFVRLTPCDGKNKIKFALRSQIKREKRRIVVFTDTDEGEEMSFEQLPAFAGEAGQWTKVNDCWYRSSAREEVFISRVEWGAGLQNQVGVPDEKTLERLLCSILVGLEPTCGQRVSDWLSELPPLGRWDASQCDKSHFLSYIAGWFPTKQNAIFEHIWREEETRISLLKYFEGRRDLIVRQALGLVDANWKA